MKGADLLDAVFNPGSVAVAGASGQPGAGQRFLEYLVEFGFQGKVYPLHPRGGEALGLKVYPNVQDVPGPVDCVISCVAAARVPQLVDDCAAKGVRFLVLHTAGFSETGREEGLQLETEVIGRARASGVRLVGPNCMGVYSPGVGLSFGRDFPKDGGPVALICQSGTNAIFTVRAAAERGVRFSKVVSYGNACDVDESELLEYLARDPETRIVAAYIEGVKDGRKFSEALKRLSAAKPVVVLKAGSTPDGARAAASHTGSLAGSDVAWNAVLTQAGAIRVDSLDELVDAVVTLLYVPVPRGNRVALFGVGGGVSVMATDECSAAGFVVPPLTEDLRLDLLTAIGSDAGAMLRNPIDLPFWLPGDETYRRLLGRLLAWEEADLFMFLAPLRHTELDLSVYRPLLEWQLGHIIEVGAGYRKPKAVVINYLATGESWQAATDFQRRCYEAGLASYHSTAGALRAIGRVMRYYAR